jgi:hypothetical protein
VVCWLLGWFRIVQARFQELLISVVDGSLIKEKRMEFFWEWIETRLRENGWPKTSGWINKKSLLAEEAIVEATQDALRIAITIGANHPDVAKSIASEFLGESGQVTQLEVDQWISEANQQGENKMSELAWAEPAWLRFCSFEATKDGEKRQFPWIGSKDEYEDGGRDATDRLNQSIVIAGIAMSWALRHPEDAVSVFDMSKSPSVKSPENLISTFDEIAFSGWLHMAEELITRYRAAGRFVDYQKLPSGL